MNKVLFCAFAIAVLIQVFHVDGGFPLNMPHRHRDSSAIVFCYSFSKMSIVNARFLEKKALTYLREMKFTKKAITLKTATQSKAARKDAIKLKITIQTKAARREAMVTKVMARVNKE